MARAFQTLTTATKSGDYSKQLHKLAEILAESIDTCEDERTLPSLARQYRETMKELEELEGGVDEGDAIAAITARRENGKSNAVKARGSKV